MRAKTPAGSWSSFFYGYPPNTADMEFSTAAFTTKPFDEPERQFVLEELTAKVPFTHKGSYSLLMYLEGANLTYLDELVELVWSVGEQLEGS